MQIRCYHCHRPFALGKEALRTAAEIVSSENLSHYNAPCPHCSRINRISRDELLRAVPDWDRQAQEGKVNDTDT